MFSYYKKNKEKAIRIIQEDPTYIETFSDIKLIEAWITKIFVIDTNREEKEVPELVISLFLTNSTIDICVKIAKEWFNGDITKLNLKSRLQ